MHLDSHQVTKLKLDACLIFITSLGNAELRPLTTLSEKSLALIQIHSEVR